MTDSNEQLAIPGAVAAPHIDPEQVNQVLLETLKELESVGRPPTASELRLALKRRTYGGFDFRPLGFKRFRDFLAAAESQGLVELDFSRPGDIAVRRRGAIFAQGQVPRIRRDVWKALVDWSKDTEHYFDLANDRVERLPSKPVPLEPERFQQLRNRFSQGDESLLRMPSIDIKTQVAWMREFVSSLDMGAMRALLTEALESDRPSKNFTSILREHPSVHQAWLQVFGQRATAVIEEWQRKEPRVAGIKLSARENLEHLDAAVEVPVKSGREQLSKPHAAGDSASLWRLLTSPEHLPSNAHLKSPSVREELMRSALHRAIDRMPVSELEKLAIPFGYLWDEV